MDMLISPPFVSYDLFSIESHVGSDSWKVERNDIMMNQLKGEIKPLLKIS